MTAIAYVITVTDGVTLRTIHPAALGAAAPDVERIVRDHLFGEAQPARAAHTADTGTFTQRELAFAQGFTGDACPSCGSFMMKRAGTCLTCQACGATTGCG